MESKKVVTKRICINDPKNPYDDIVLTDSVKKENAIYRYCDTVTKKQQGKKSKQLRREIEM